MPPYFALLENEIFIQKINAGSLNGKILLVHMVLWEPHLYGNPTSYLFTTLHPMSVKMGKKDNAVTCNSPDISLSILLCWLYIKNYD